MAKEDSDVTKVIFKKAHYEDGTEEILAFFPACSATPGRIMCYAHVGQHSEADFDFFRTACRPCSEKEYAPLKKEMEDFFGYRFRIMKRMTSQDRRDAWMRNVRRKDDNQKPGQV